MLQNGVKSVAFTFNDATAALFKLFKKLKTLSKNLLLPSLEYIYFILFANKASE